MNVNEIHNVFDIIYIITFLFMNILFYLKSYYIKYIYANINNNVIFAFWIITLIIPMYFVLFTVFLCMI